MLVRYVDYISRNVADVFARHELPVNVINRPRANLDGKGHGMARSDQYLARISGHRSLLEVIESHDSVAQGQERDQTNMDNSSLDNALFLGLDLSTQSLTIIAVDMAGAVTHSQSINFLRDLPHHKTPVHREPPSATTPSALFLEALDEMFSAMKAANFPFPRVRGVSGAAQQHGSVFLTADFAIALSALSPTKTLLEQIPLSAFAFPDGPIWEDASTSPECAELERALGGPLSMAAATGARATLRFTGPQILARARRDPAHFATVTRVALISAFVASVLTGALVPEDVADACGTHLFDLRSDPPAWMPAAVAAAQADGLLSPAPVRSGARVGCVSDYFCERYGLAQSTPVVAFTGDNPATIAALGGIPNRAVLVSLGTSDTAQWAVGADALDVDARAADIAMTFRSPMADAPEYFRMLVYSNGSLTREAVRDESFASESREDSVSWEMFEEMVARVPAGCHPAKVGCFYLRPEIAPRVETPRTPWAVDVLTGAEVKPTHAENCRLVLEWRALVLASHLGGLGMGEAEKVMLTGGAAESKVMPQILADVLNAPVYKICSTASAALGAARRAREVALQGLGRDMDILPAAAEKSILVAEPRADACTMYRAVHIPAYEKYMEER